MRDRDGEPAWECASGGVQRPVSESSELCRFADVSGTSAGGFTRGEGIGEGNGYSSVEEVCDISECFLHTFNPRARLQTWIEDMLRVERGRWWRRHVIPTSRVGAACSGGGTTRQTSALTGHIGDGAREVGLAGAAASGQSTIVWHDYGG